jgi:hypothetical protein
MSTAKFIASDIDESISAVHWWNATDEGRKRCHFAPYKLHMDWPGIGQGYSR